MPCGEKPSAASATFASTSPCNFEIATLFDEVTIGSGISPGDCRLLMKVRSYLPASRCIFGNRSLWCGASD